MNLGFLFFLRKKHENRDSLYKSKIFGIFNPFHLRPTSIHQHDFEQPRKETSNLKIVDFSRGDEIFR